MLYIINNKSVTTIIIMLLSVFTSCNYSENNSSITHSDEDIPDIFTKFEKNYSADILEIKKAGKWTFARYVKNNSVGLVAIFNDSIIFTNDKLFVDEFYFTFLSKMNIVAKQTDNSKNTVYVYEFNLSSSSNKWTLSYAEKKEITKTQNTYFFTNKFEQKISLNDFSSFDFTQSNVYQYVFSKVNSLEDISNQLNEMRKNNTVLLKKFFTPEHAEELLQYYPVNAQNVIVLNNIGFYLEQMSVNLPSIIILEAVLNEYPNRTIACLNLGDALLKNNMKIKGKAYYDLYIKLMKEKGKEKEIAQRAYM